MGRERFRFLSIKEAQRLMDSAKKIHTGELQLPSVIVAKKKEIERAIRTAELFQANVGTIDYNMVYRAVDLKMELDGLYVQYAAGELQ